MSFVKHPIGVDLSDGVSVPALDGQPYGGRKWPIHYDSVEPLAVVADLATIILASVFSGLSYHLLQESGTPVDVGKSLGSAILVSALFISLMKIRGDERVPSARRHSVCAEDRK
jgi:putative colanic acid biosysnthesis UDP-glucose lipid carrier transferase